MNVEMSMRHMAVSQSVIRIEAERCSVMHHKCGGIQNIDKHQDYAIDNASQHLKQVLKRCHAALVYRQVSRVVSENYFLMPTWDACHE